MNKIYNTFTQKYFAILANYNFKKSKRSKKPSCSTVKLGSTQCELQYEFPSHNLKVVLEHKIKVMLMHGQKIENVKKALGCILEF